MQKQNTIIWQKWSDPFGEDLEDVTDTDNFHDDDEDTETSNDIDNYWADHEEKKISKNIIKGVKVIATPMGIIPINDNTASGKIFNFWIGHTNFDITKNICEIIEKTDGVECLDIFTRYRFRIAIGKAFNDANTMSEIQKNVYEYINYDEQ